MPSKHPVYHSDAEAWPPPRPALQVRNQTRSVVPATPWYKRENSSRSHLLVNGQNRPRSNTTLRHRLVTLQLLSTAQSLGEPEPWVLRAAYSVLPPQPPPTALSHLSPFPAPPLTPHCPGSLHTCPFHSHQLSLEGTRSLLTDHFLQRLDHHDSPLP